MRCGFHQHKSNCFIPITNVLKLKNDVILSHTTNSISFYSIKENIQLESHINIFTMNSSNFDLEKNQDNSKE